MLLNFLTEYPLKGNEDVNYVFGFYYSYLLPFALMQKVPPKNQGCINPWLKINVSVGRKPDSLRSDSGFLLNRPSQ
ncbi:hypothetical protein D3C71_168440 [compost metagenome]